jgi:hypothetical protein
MSTYPVTVRPYLLKRIQELASGSSLAAYRWNSGGTKNDTGKPWAEGLPTDAELVMHVFATWIDIQMPGASFGVATYAPFSAKYYRTSEGEKDGTVPLFTLRSWCCMCPVNEVNGLNCLM